MDKALKAITDKWADREKREEAREDAKAYVAAHRDELGQTFDGMAPDQIVAYVERAREDGDQDAEARANVWFLGALPQQRVVGGN